ncbi:alpha/beta hydrolase [Cohnella lubricantis]|uniref:Lysophospholipase n=1 Tax=Cohnella lubricantis TaxID=2163172 RepID=A0A841TDT2_9BACL|nr:alpha/beta hydrolase [Cohnella lubricantis]MBB6677137.1 lysophospholipase [Cohnella lubricantis]MBP2118985.1 alpha-beta hydrolase superfamily lysophospholipase [Cohnella lubricantis]
MADREWVWELEDGTRMHACEWKTEMRSPIRGIIGIVHGMGEHIGRYEHVAGALTAEGYAVLGFDQYGHGQTAGRRGHVPHYEALLEGPDRMIREARTRYPGVPVFLLGHSMGGNVTINYLLRRQPDIAGAVVTGPWLKLAFDPPKAQVVVGRLLERIYPQYNNHRPLAVERLTSDPEMIQKIASDELGHGHITAKFFFGVRRAGLWALEHADRLSVPMLLMHGGDDKVTAIAASRLFAERAGAICTFLEWPGYRHELHNESGRSAVFKTIFDWLEKERETTR